MADSVNVKHTRQSVRCNICYTEIVRVVWNYKHKRPVAHFFCGHACKGVWQRRQREETIASREWLQNQYISKGRSANDIAKELGRDPKRIWEWLRNYGIILRPRGHNISRLPKDGSPFRGKRHTLETRQALSQQRLKDGHVPYLKNGVHWLKATGRKPAAWKGGITPERQALYSSDAWKSAVKVVWRRADAKCERCGRDHRKVDNRSKDGFHIHHIDSFAIRERRTTVSNLILVCRPCHRWIHGAANIEREFLGQGH